MRITIAQLNPVVGDIPGNLDRIREVTRLASENSADLVVFSELFITGYPPRDLLERPWFVSRAEAAITEVVEFSKACPQTGILFGAPVRVHTEAGRGLHNSAVLVSEGRVLAVLHKSLLPTYDVFDEARYFDPSPEIRTVEFRGEVLGISICEDAWNDKAFWPRRLYQLDPVNELAMKGATLLINLSASPFHVGKDRLRFEMIRTHAREHSLPFVFVNQVGANDELVFDGQSMMFDRRGEPVAVLPAFREHIETVDTEERSQAAKWEPRDAPDMIHEALVLGVRDYMRKCGFRKAVVGLSGGIDSAVVACIACEATGPENVLGIAMPSRFSKSESTLYAEKLAMKLGMGFKVIPIDSVYQAYYDCLRQPLGLGDTVDVTLENVQSRIRGNILMAVSNKFGHLVLSTGNKSELAVGYTTLYGDMSGGLAVISDVPKTLVYKLAERINRDGEVIPRWIIERVPTAELRPNQTDQDTLPPYPTLDEIIRCYVDQNMSAEEIAARGFDASTVRWVAGAVDRNEYKRRQAALGLKVTSKAFGIGRRMPIAAKYSE